MPRFSNISAACLCAIAALASLAAARAPQDPPPQPATIVLPRKLVAGSRATLAVLDAGGHLVPGTAVELAGFGEVKTDATGRAIFVAPAGVSSLSANLLIGGATATAPIISANAYGTGNSSTSAQLVSVPAVIAVGEPFDVGGSGWDGDASHDRVATGDQPAFVLAASPLSLVALPNPEAVLGDVQLSLTLQGQRIGSRLVTVVALDLAGPANPLATGATGAFVLHVAGSTKPALVQVNNSTPEVIELPGGNTRRLATSGGAENSATLQVASIRPGDYAVSVHLLPVMQGTPDEETAQLELIDVRGIADAKWQKRIDGVLLLMKRQPADLARVRQEVFKDLREHPPSRIEDSLRVASQLLAAS